MMIDSNTYSRLKEYSIIRAIHWLEIEHGMRLSTAWQAENLRVLARV